MNKLTPEATKTIDNLVLTLPKFQKKHPVNGNLMFRTLTKRVQGKDLPKWYKKSHDWSPMEFYTYKYKEPILVNHKVNLIECFKKDGYTGLQHYVNALSDFYDKNKITKVGFLPKILACFSKYLMKKKGIIKEEEK